MNKIKSNLIAICSLLFTLGAASNQTFSQTTYCSIPNYVDNNWEWITNVTFAGINQSSLDNNNAYGDYTTGTPGTVTIGTPYTISVTIEDDDDEHITAFIDWNQNGSFLDPGEKYLIAQGVATNGPFTSTITPPASALVGSTRMRVILDWDNLTGGDPCLNEPIDEEVYGEAEDYTIIVQNATTPAGIDSVVITTAASVAPEINTLGGSLQLQANIYPTNAAQSVTWSLINNSGSATITTSGLVTAGTDGTVWAKARSTVDTTKTDSLLITISNQTVPIASLTVSTQGNVAPSITINGGTLQVIATVMPSNATQNVLWSIIPGTGNASISNTGLITATANGTIWAKATSTFDTSKMDSLAITISNQIDSVTQVTITTQANVPAAITTPGGTLQLTATVLPATASQDVDWSIVTVDGNASISTSGLITAIANGAVWAVATSTENATISDSLLIQITNQSVSVRDLFEVYNISVFPNPFDSHISLQSTNENEQLSITIIDVLGREVVPQTLVKNAALLNVSHLQSGTYILMLTEANGNRSIQKIIKK